MPHDDDENNYIFIILMKPVLFSRRLWQMMESVEITRGAELIIFVSLREIGIGRINMSRGKNCFSFNGTKQMAKFH